VWDEAVVTINEPPEITLNYDSITIDKNESFDLIATVTPANSTVTWSVEGEDGVVEFSDITNLSRTVTGLKRGMVTITASIHGASASCEVTVYDDYWNATTFEEAEVEILEEFSSLEYIGYLDEDMSVNWFAYTPEVDDIGTLVDIIFESDNPNITIERFRYDPNLSPPLVPLPDIFDFQPIMVGDVLS
jgi:hypothetical protein